jgi:hypothetical protein
MTDKKIRRHEIKLMKECVIDAREVASEVGLAEKADFFVLAAEFYRNRRGK